MNLFAPVSQFTARSIICYEEYQGESRKIASSPLSASNLTRGHFKGEMSLKTRTDLRKKLNVYYDAMYQLGSRYRKEKNIFHPIITLTLPASQAHSDNEIKRSCLMRFLESLKYNYDVRFYYWVAEKQLNGNIHFHVLIDRFVDHVQIRTRWNDRLETLGYISAFAAKGLGTNPNSTDIQAIRNLSKSSDYVTKYTSKADQQGGIQGRLHGECDLLRQCVRYKEIVWSELNEKLHELASLKMLKVKRLDNCVVYEGDIRRIMAGHMPLTLKRWNDAVHALGSQFYN